MATTIPHKTEKKLNSKSSNFPVVAIGASAGGPDAGKKILNNLSVDAGMAFVIIQHLHPTHETVLTSTGSEQTTTNVVEVTEQIRVERNWVYIIPPGKDMAIFLLRRHWIFMN